MAHTNKNSWKELNVGEEPMGTQRSGGRAPRPIRGVGQGEGRAQWRAGLEDNGVGEFSGKVNQDGPGRMLSLGL